MPFDAFSGAGSLLVATPQSAAVVIGSNVVLKCLSNEYSSIRWEFLQQGITDGDATVLVGTANHEPNTVTQNYTVQSDVNGRFILTIVNLKLEDAGKYICKESGLGMEAVTELIILGKPYVKNKMTI